MKKQKIIIKKVKSQAHEGGHGGSWKVAYADFVTAMMAFFLLLWLITMVAPERRARVSAYFKHFNLFEKAGSSMVMDQAGQGVGSLGGEFSSIPQEMGKGVSDLVDPRQVENRLKNQVETRLGDVKDQILVDVFEGGVRIQVTDKEGRPIFRLGGTEPSDSARKILGVIAENIRDLENKIAIEGHTDALSYASSRYTNWELSTDRASAARKLLEDNGLHPDRIARVAGFAATEPLVKENPNDPRNRRISIILIYPQGKSSAGSGAVLPQEAQLSPAGTDRPGTGQPGR